MIECSVPVVRTYHRCSSYGHDELVVRAMGPLPEEMPHGSGSGWMNCGKGVWEYRCSTVHANLPFGCVAVINTWPDNHNDYAELWHREDEPGEFTELLQGFFFRPMREPVESPSDYLCLV